MPSKTRSVIAGWSLRGQGLRWLRIPSAPGPADEHLVDELHVDVGPVSPAESYFRAGQAPADQGLLPSPFRAFPNLRHAPGWASGTGTDIGASSNSAAWAPASRPGASSQTAVSGSVPSAIRSRPGTSNAAHANFEDCPTEPRVGV